MPTIPRKVLLEKFHVMVARHVPIVGGGAGTGLSAKGEEAGGIDLTRKFKRIGFRTRRAPAKAVAAQKSMAKRTGGNHGRQIRDG